MTTKILGDQALDILFRQARTYSKWQSKDVSDVLLHALYDLLKFGPTSANCSPARFVFVKSKEGKERLKPHLDGGNVEKTMGAPVTVIIGQDLKFYDHLPTLFPHTDARSWFVGNEPLIKDTAFRNASLQGAYLMLAARSLGLDCGGMSGFNAEGVKKEFFADQPSVTPNFLCNIGYGDESSLRPRHPRLSFEQVAKII
ncbi:MAG: malonic semialdehyde reductase [Alphaproteobacteria bacterium]|nr:malonic semialdehyde reductase [Alphaproteobacteria bacterium]